MDTKKLKIEHLKFVEAYCEHGNATQAYLASYPDVTYDSARSEGSRLLTNPNVAAAIESRKEKLALDAKITKEQLVRELTASAVEAKEAGDYKAYSTIKNMIIKMFGYYEPDGIKISGDAKLSVIKTVEVKTEEDEEKDSEE